MTSLLDTAAQGVDALREVTIRDGDVSLSLLNYGAITRDWRVPCGGKRVPVVLGFEDPADYFRDPYYIGTIAGRVSNRIGGAAFELDGVRYQLVANEGANIVHGGPKAMWNSFWEIEADGDRAARLSYHSPDGENGFPGNADVSMVVRLDGHLVTYDFEVVVDRPTPISLAQHSYYNLMGAGTVWDHQMRLAVDRALVKAPDSVSTGEIMDVAGTAYDFREMKRFDVAAPDKSVTDGHLVFREDRGLMDPVAEIVAPNGMRMKMWSDQDGLQFYVPAGIDPIPGGHDGAVYPTASSFCLEPQGYPNAVNIPSFPSMIVHPEAPYQQRLQIEIKAD